MRTVFLVAALVALGWPAWAEERVLYCAETGSVGFHWQKGLQTEGKITPFNEIRYVVKVQSETKRTVTQTTGDLTGIPAPLTCRRPLAGRGGMFERLVCDDRTGTNPWLFYENQFVHARMSGPTVGYDLGISISYGTCTGF